MRRRTALLALPLVHGVRVFSDVAAKYAPLRTTPSLFEPEQISTWLHPEFAAFTASVADADVTDTAALVRDFVTCEERDIFSFPLLTDEACDALICEVEAFQKTGLPARRPNSMNNYGAPHSENKRSLVENTRSKHLICFPLRGLGRPHPQ